MLLAWDGAAVLIDTGTDLRQQALAHGLTRLDAVLYTHAAELRAAQEIWPKITFHAMREHGGRVVHSDRLAA